MDIINIFNKINKKNMKKYLFLFRGGDMSKLSPEEMQQHMEEWGSWIKGLGEKGIFVAGEPLGKEGKVINGTKKVVTDGPFAESKEVVGGYLIVNAEDINEAAKIARDCPIHKVNGTTEVRDIHPLNM
jgi:hypothetical protein